MFLMKVVPFAVLVCLLSKEVFMFEFLRRSQGRGVKEEAPRLAEEVTRNHERAAG